MNTGSSRRTVKCDGFWKPSRPLFIIAQGPLWKFYGHHERKLIEEALRQSEEKYRTIIENIEDGYVELDLKGNFTFFNDAISKMHGHRKIDLLKMNYRDIMDEDNARKIYAIYNKVLPRPAEKEFEYEIITKRRIQKESGNIHIHH